MDDCAECFSREIIKNLPGGIGVLRIGSKFEPVYFNAAGARIFGCEEEELAAYMQGDVLTVIVGEDSQRLCMEVRQAAVSREDLDCTLRIRNKSGEQVFVRINGRVVEAFDKSLMLYCNLQDQTQECCDEELMTGLYDRDEIAHMVERYLMGSQQKKAVFYMIDIDNLKAINDTWGRLLGDKVIEKVADRLRQVFGKKDKMGRVGGDEFIVFSPDISDEREALQKGSYLCEALNLLVNHNGKKQEISCSIGIALVPEHGTDFKTLYHHADIARYAAGKAGSRQFRMYGSTPLAGGLTEKSTDDTENPNKEDFFERVEILLEELEVTRLRAEHDKLTGLYNRERFLTAAKEMMFQNPEESYVLIRTDIYRFKIINDLFGRETGDLILRTVAENFVKEVGKEGQYARIEGDDFAILLPKCALDVRKLEEKALQTMQSLDLNFNVVAYMGIYEIEDINDPVELMCDRAQMALRVIKGDYLKRVIFYKDSLRESIISEQEVLKDMKSLREEQQFIVHYQPIYIPDGSQLVSAEALVRWIHPKKGLLPPDSFIPLFEKNGFIMKTDQFVWEHVCQYISKRKREGKHVVPVSVNVSRISLYNKNLVELLLDLVHRYDIEPKFLRLEITESAYMDNAKQLIDMTKKMREYGFQVLMDDFGTGYSSLNMLKDIPIDALKLDRYFMQDIGLSKRAEQVIVGIIRVADALGIRVIAEGIEREQQREFLEHAGCHSIQGYLFSRPVKEHEFTALLDNPKKE